MNRDEGWPDMEEFIKPRHIRASGGAVCNGSDSAHHSGIGRSEQEYGSVYFQRLREVIDHTTEDATPFCGNFEVDEGYFLSMRKWFQIPGKDIESDIGQRIALDSMVYPDAYSLFNELDILSEFKHYSDQPYPAVR